MSSVVDPGPERISVEQVVLVDFPPRAGLKEVSIKPQDLAARSTQALDNAMDSIRSMAARVNSTARTLAGRPDEVSVEFGLKLDAEAGALIARTGVEAHIVVTLRWGAEGGTSTG